MRLGVKVSSSTARQLDSELDRARQASTRSTSKTGMWDLALAERTRVSTGLEPHSFKVKVDGDPLVNYTTWWLDEG